MHNRSDSDAESDSEYIESASSSSEYTEGQQAQKRSKTKQTKSKKKKKNTKKMSMDEDEPMDHVPFESNLGDKILPEAVVCLKFDESKKSLAPSAHLFDILNDGASNLDVHRMDENIKSFALRKRAMDEVLSKMDKRIEQMIENADRSIFEQIVQFAQNAYSRNSTSPMQYLWNLNQHIMPTAMLMCGQNVSDHPLHFEHLTSEIKQNVTPLIVRFRKNDLRQNGSFSSKLDDVQSFIVGSIFDKLKDWKVPKHGKSKKIKCGESPHTNQETDEKETEYFCMETVLKLPPISLTKNEPLRTFMLWYFANASKINQYWKRNNFIQSCFDNLPKIVIMIDCIEQWSPAVLSALIYTLHSFNDSDFDASSLRIPFVLVFGVSSTDNLLSRMIESDALRLLSVRRFYFKSSYNLYRELAEEILIESSPILFDCNILNKLLSHCQLNDYSVARFKDQIRYLFMSYFSNTERSQFAAYFMLLKEQKSEDELLKVFDSYWIDEDNGSGNDNKEQFQDDLQFTFDIYQKYRTALKVFKAICDTLDLRWSQSEIIAKLQNKESLYKHLLARVGAEDSKYKISSHEKLNYPQRISNFTECHQIYKILEQDTQDFDAEFSELASDEYLKITTKLNADKGANGLNEIIANTNKKKKLSRDAFKRQMMQKTNKNLYGEGRKNLFKLLTKFI